MKVRVNSQRPVVFVGPSIPRERAMRILEADYRPPIRRGDLASIPPGAVVAIIDGVFDQDLAVTTTEIRVALQHGIEIFGSSSIGALRAVEVPGVHGVGRIYEMYRTGSIENDDEVAIVFDPQTFRPLAEPLVNVRHAVAQLAGPGTISPKLAKAIVLAAARLPYTARTYRNILRKAGLNWGNEASHLASMLSCHDLKQEDAISLLEQLRDISSVERISSFTTPKPKLNRLAIEPSDSIHCWEFGPPLAFAELVNFMALTGSLTDYALRAVAWLQVAGNAIQTDTLSQKVVLDRLLAQTARAWHWATEEEVETSLADIGLQYNVIETGLTLHVEQELKAMSLTQSQNKTFFTALGIVLFLDDLSLKRETARALSLKWLAKLGQEFNRTMSVADEERVASYKLCQILDVRDIRAAVEYLRRWGITAKDVRQFISQLAFARRTSIDRRSIKLKSKILIHPWLKPCPKAAGSRRFCFSLRRSYASVKRLKSVVGITRVAVITGLGPIGIPNAQAFRPDGEWSSTVGSGKSESVTGAKVGAMMEEIEKWAQEVFALNKQHMPDAVSSFENLQRRKNSVINPSLLDLPYDSCYTPHLELSWHFCTDLLVGGKALLPTAAITHRRLQNDIYYSTRGGRKTVTTSGLAAGMTITEALTHALCECIERHARAVDAVSDGNPGGPHVVPRHFIDLDTVPGSTRSLIQKVLRARCKIVVRDISSEIAIPVFSATIFLPEGSLNGKLFGDGWQRASGWASHPDPETAINMAILEASQTIMSHVAGSREDLVLQARSLGRHDRTDSRRRASLAAELDPDAPRCSFTSIKGFSSSDAAEDVRWILERLRESGWNHALIADYSQPEINPVRVVRAIIPGLETINPFYTGLCARRALLCDLVPYSR